MNSKNQDIVYLKKWLTSLKLRHYAGVAGGVVIITALYFVGGHRENIDRTNYKTVSESFITKSGLIANKIGKVLSTSHIGVGGDTGSVSYNVYNLKGETKSGVCYITLNKDNEGLWFVDSVTLMSGGAEYNIPVSRADGGKPPSLFK